MMEATLKPRRNWWGVPRREPNGRKKRIWTPDRGTDQIQAKRKAVTGNARSPIDLDDPIDVLHRGKDPMLTDTQALAAQVWRSAKRDLLAGEGPRLAIQKDGVRGEEPEPNPEREQRARQTLQIIKTTLLRHHSGVHHVCVEVVEHKRPTLRIEYLQQGLSEIAKALRL
jgi:hypothetical protein